MKLNSITWTRATSKERFPEPISPLGWSILQPALRASLEEMGKVLGVEWADPNQVVTLKDSYIYTRKGFFDGAQGLRFLPKVWFRLLFVLFWTSLKDFIGGLWKSDRQGWERVPLMGSAINIAKIRKGKSPSEAFLGFCDRLAWELFGKSSVQLVELWPASWDVLLKNFRTPYTGQTGPTLEYAQFKKIREEMEKHSRAYFAQDFVVYFLKTILEKWISKSLKWSNALTSNPATLILALGKGFEQNFSVKMALDFNNNQSSSLELRQRYGHLTDNWDIRAPMMGERPHLWEKSDSSKFNSLLEQHRKGIADRIRAEQEVSQAFRSRPLMVRMIAIWQKLVAIDEDMRAYSTLQYPELRRLLNLVCQTDGWKNSQIQDDLIYFCSIDEIEEGLEQNDFGPLKNILPKRAEEFERNSKMTPLFELGPEDTKNESEAGFTGNGIVVNSGLVRGQIRLVKSFEDLKNFERQEILAVKNPTPVFSHYYSVCAGVVSETGGVLSHGAIVAREFGIPMLTEVDGVFESFKTGDWVELDADRGIFKKLEQGNEV